MWIVYASCSHAVSWDDATKCVLKASDKCKQNVLPYYCATISSRTQLVIEIR